MSEPQSIERLDAIIKAVASGVCPDRIVSVASADRDSVSGVCELLTGTYGMGQCCSMGFMIISSGEKGHRYSLPNTMLKNTQFLN